MLAVAVVGYFALENTVLDRFNRFVVMVYPIIIWGLIGIISKNWGLQDPNVTPVITLLLLVLVIILFAARIVMIICFAKYRQISYKLSNGDDQKQDEKIPL